MGGKLCSFFSFSDLSNTLYQHYTNSWGEKKLVAVLKCWEVSIDREFGGYYLGLVRVANDIYFWMRYSLAHIMNARCPYCPPTRLNRTEELLLEMRWFSWIRYLCLDY